MNIWKPRQIKSVTTNWWQLRSSTGSYDQLAGCQICSYDQQGLTVTTNFLIISRFIFSLPAELKHMVIAEIHSVIWHRHVSVIWAQRTVRHYGNQSRDYFNGGRPSWPPAVSRLAARPSQSNPRGSGPEALKRERGHVTVETWSFCGGGLQGPQA